MKVNPTDLNHGLTDDFMNGFEPWVRGTVNGLSPANRKTVLEFLNYLNLGGARPSTIEGYVLMLGKFKTNGKSYHEIEYEDLLAWLRWLDSNGYRARTVNALRARAKRFMRWIYTQDDPELEPPKMLEVIKVKRIQRGLPKQILTELEIRELVDAAQSQRDRTLTFVGYESGGRPGEVLGARLRDLEFDQYGAVLRVSGKTGERRIRLFQSVPDLKLWLSMHPCKDNPSASLWPTRLRSREHIGIAEFEQLLASYSKLAGIKKHVYPYLLRHTRATHLANVLTEAQMREFFGWTKNSPMPAIYVHLSGRDLDPTLLKYYGIKVECEERVKEALAPKLCPSCEHENSPCALYCDRCHAPLTLGAVAEAQSKQSRASDQLFELVQEFIRRNPDLVEQFLAERKQQLVV